MKPFTKLVAILMFLIAGRALAVPDFAINVDGFADWMSSRAYIDASVMFRRWGMAGAGWQENPAIKLTADNYPLVDADAVSLLRGYPAGVYTMRYEGAATVNFVGFAAIVPGTLQTAGGVTSAKVEVKPHQGEDLVTLQVRNLNPNNTLHNFQLLVPGYPDAKKVFTDEFVRRVRPFPTIRFMDWQQTNGQAVREWADRAKPTMFGRTSAKGVPIEEIVMLANATRRNVWVNIPLPASDDYVKQFATFLRDKLHKDAIIHFEYGNEIWNFGFPHAKDNLLAAKANGNLNKPDDFGRCAQQAADKLGHFAQIFKQVFGDKDYARVRPVVGGFIASSYWAQTQIEWLGARYPGLVKEIAIAPYFGVEGDIADVDKPGASANAMFDKLNSWIDTKIAEWIQAHAVLARNSGMGLVSYEGGVHLTATNSVNEGLKRQMQNDKRMAETYRHLFNVWDKNGGGLFTQFGHISPHTKFGFWGLLESAEQPGSVKWDMYLSLLLPPGDANLDGKVDFADFQILKANYNKTGTWWEQGDFNGDGKVDAEDLKLLKANLKATPAERAEVQKLK